MLKDVREPAVAAGWIVHNWHIHVITVVLTGVWDIPEKLRWFLGLFNSQTLQTAIGSSD